MEPVPKDGVPLSTLDDAVPDDVAESIVTKHEMMTASVKDKVNDIFKI